MAHFAKLDENNVVTMVVVVNNSGLLVDGVESEAKGVEFLVNLFGDSNWKQTSFNATIRKNAAGIGYTYDPDRDAFIEPKKYFSWTLDEETCLWVPPVPMPIDDKFYIWIEEVRQWIEYTPFSR
jgi:hypothetical protein